jgi:hypothetical protein
LQNCPAWVPSKRSFLTHGSCAALEWSDVDLRRGQFTTVARLFLPGASWLPSAIAKLHEPNGALGAEKRRPRYGTDEGESARDATAIWFTQSLHIFIINRPQESSTEKTLTVHENSGSWGTRLHLDALYQGDAARGVQRPARHHRARGHRCGAKRAILPDLANTDAPVTRQGRAPTTAKRPRLCVAPHTILFVSG